LLEGDAAWSVLLGVASVLTLAAGVSTVLAVASIVQLRRDAKIIAAAESFEAVDLTTVVKRHVPAEQQTNLASEEIALAKQAVVARRPRLKWRAAVSGAVLACGAAATVLSAHRYLEVVARSPSKARVNLDVVKDIQGVWGFRADSLQSCSKNPQTIQVAPDRRTLTLRYAKPYKWGSATLTELNFEIVSVKPNMLVLLRTDPPESIVGFSSYDVVFIDANTMSWSPSKDGTVSSGAIERCVSTRR
jgi:hypothetical protein